MQKVVLPLVQNVQQTLGWQKFHKDPKWTFRRQALEEQAITEIETIMGTKHIKFYEAKCRGVPAPFSTLKGIASSASYANCPPLVAGKAIIDNGGRGQSRWAAVSSVTIKKMTRG